jgi:ssDNA-binding Zn-finger/Zn-ribbon topoisomerase 1
MPEPANIDYDKIRLPCPECGNGTLVVRQNRENGSRFMGCTNWPKRQDEDGRIVGCDKTAPIPQYFLLRAQGAEVLPGFE